MKRRSKGDNPHFICSLSETSPSGAEPSLDGEFSSLEKLLKKRRRP